MMWVDFDVAKARAELPRLIEEAETAVAAVEAAHPVDYEGLVWALDDASRGLWECWGKVSHLLGVMNSPEWRRIEEEWQPKLVAFSLRVGQSRAIYDAAKRLAAAERDPVRRRILV